MRILGIDPGTRAMGYGVIERQGTRVRCLASGVITPAPGELAFRLATIFAALEAVVAAHRPDEVAVEDLFHARNAKSALVLGHARGVALLVAGRAGLSVHAYAPPIVKKAVVGHGRAEKFQVQKMVRALLGLETEPAEDEADALAVALCHSARSMVTAALEASAASPASARGAPVIAARSARSSTPRAARPSSSSSPASTAPPVRPGGLIPASELAAAMARKGSPGGARRGRPRGRSAP